MRELRRFIFLNFSQVPVHLRGAIQFPKQVLCTVAWGHLKTVSDKVVIDVAWHGSDGVRNALCITFAVRKLQSSFIVVLKYGINHFALPVQHLSVKFFTWLIDRALAWLFFSSLPLFVSTTVGFYHIGAHLTKRRRSGSLVALVWHCLALPLLKPPLSYCC